MDAGEGVDNAIIEDFTIKSRFSLLAEKTGSTACRPAEACWFDRIGKSA
jgi:hypothetical protein